MAVVNTLKLTFVTAAGDTKTINLKHAKSNPSISGVKTAMNTVISNNSIFANQYAVKKSAKLVQTEETPIDISE